MRIISQNGLISVPFEMTAIHANGTFIRMNMAGNTREGIIIAEYNTLEKVEKAIQLLHEAYIVNENFKKMDAELQLQILGCAEKETQLKYGGIFQFPKEEDL
jgi:hypothetical protein